MKTRKMRLLSFVLAVAMMFAIVPVSAFAENDNAELTGYCGADASYEAQTYNYSKATADGNVSYFPDPYYSNAIWTLTPNATGYTLKISGTGPIADFGKSWSYGRPWHFALAEKDSTIAVTEVKNKITEVIIGEGITRIGAHTFEAYDYITSVALPSSVTEIGENAFNSDDRLTAVTLPQNLEKIDATAFSDTGLTSIAFPESLKEIGKNAFGNAKLTGDLIIPNNVEVIEDSAFSGNGNNGLTGNLTIGNAVKTIGSNAFSGGKFTGELKIPASVRTIGNNAFQGCNFSSLSLSEGLETIGENAFYNAGSFTGKLIIPDSVKTIGKTAFTGQSSIVSIRLGNSVCKVEDSAFSNCTGVKILDLASTNQVTYGSGAFVSMSNPNTIYVNSESQKEAISNCITENRSAFAVTNGGTLAEDAPYAENQLATPKKIGYTFNGWVDKDGNAFTGDLSANKVYYANWKADTYTVTVDYAGKGGTNYETPVTYPNTMDEPKHEDVDGYTFGGWYDGNTKVTFPLKVTANTTLTAKWYLNAAVIEPAAACKVTVENGTAWVGDQQVEFVAPGETVTIKANQDIVDGMKFGHWEVRKGKVELANEELDETTFVMPAEPVEVAVMLKDEANDDGIDAATVVTGVVLGTGTAILAYHIGTEVYAEQVLGKGVAIPRTREEVALKAWELAGKPAVELNGEPLSVAAQAEKWAVESGLMQNDAEGSFNGAKKMNKLKALRVLDAAKKLG